MPSGSEEKILRELSEEEEDEEEEEEEEEGEDEEGGKVWLCKHSGMR